MLLLLIYGQGGANEASSTTPINPINPKPYAPDAFFGIREPGVGPDPAAKWHPHEGSLLQDCALGPTRCEGKTETEREKITEREREMVNKETRRKKQL